jgi:hypothetical protein
VSDCAVGNFARIDRLGPASVEVIGSSGEKLGVMTEWAVGAGSRNGLTASGAWSTSR